MIQTIQLKNGRIALVEKELKDTYRVKVPLADKSNLFFEIDKKAVNTKKPLWKEIIPFTKLKEVQENGRN